MYSVGIGFTMIVFWGLVLIVPPVLFIKGVRYVVGQWQDERRADRYVKRIMGE